MTDVRPATARHPDLARELEPVRRALLEDAQAAAERLLSAARADAAQVVARAQAETDEAAERARLRAEQSAFVRREEALASVRRAAHGSVLRARSELREELTRRVSAAVEQVGSDLRYPALLDHLERLARAQLGPGAVVTRDPQPGGGVIASAGSRTVDYTLPALARLALDAVADRLDPADEPVEGEPWP